MCDGIVNARFRVRAFLPSAYKTLHRSHLCVVLQSHSIRYGSSTSCQLLLLHFINNTTYNIIFPWFLCTTYVTFFFLLLFHEAFSRAPWVWHSTEKIRIILRRGLETTEAHWVVFLDVINSFYTFYETALTLHYPTYLPIMCWVREKPGLRLFILHENDTNVTFSHFALTWVNLSTNESLNIFDTYFEVLWKFENEWVCIERNW